LAQTRARSVCVVRNEVAGEVDDDGGMLAIRQLHAGDAMGVGADPQGNSRTTAPCFAVTGGGDFLDQSDLDQFRRDRRHGCRTDIQILRDLNPGNQPGGAHKLEHLLAQGALAFGQGGYQRPHALAPVYPVRPDCLRRHLFRSPK
jgi:hypothetical protein